MSCSTSKPRSLCKGPFVCMVASVGFAVTLTPLMVFGPWANLGDGVYGPLIYCPWLDGTTTCHFKLPETRIQLMIPVLILTLLSLSMLIGCSVCACFIANVSYKSLLPSKIFVASGCVAWIIQLVLNVVVLLYMYPAHMLNLQAGFYAAAAAALILTVIPTWGLYSLLVHKRIYGTADNNMWHPATDEHVFGSPSNRSSMVTMAQVAPLLKEIDSPCYGPLSQKRTMEEGSVLDESVTVCQC